MRCVLPQCASDRPLWILEDSESVCPVQASSALRWATCQSVVPSRWRTEKVVVGDLVEIRAVIGVVEEIRWYRKGTPNGALARGFNSDNVDWACISYQLDWTL